MADEKETERRVGIARMQDSLDRNNELTTEMHRAIVGNGGPGILTRLAIHGKVLALYGTLIVLILGGLVSTAWYIVKMGLIK